MELNPSLEPFSIEFRTTKTKLGTQANQNEQGQYSEPIKTEVNWCRRRKRGKTNVNESRLILALLMIGWGHAVAMVAYCFTKLITTCSPMVGHFFDIMIVASSLVITPHQNLSTVLKLFWATLSDNRHSFINFFSFCMSLIMYRWIRFSYYCRCGTIVRTRRTKKKEKR